MLMKQSVMKIMSFSGCLSLSYALLSLQPAVAELGCQPLSQSTFSPENRLSCSSSIDIYLDDATIDLLEESRQIKVNRIPDTYWEEWAFRTQDDPILTERLENSFWGLAVWKPEKYQGKTLTEAESYEDWLKLHGLQLSLGFGEKSGTAPRFRLDWRWHDSSDTDVLLQLELPFN